MAGVEKTKAETTMLNVQRDLAEIERSFKEDTYNDAVDDVKYKARNGYENLRISKNCILIFSDLDFKVPHTLVQLNLPFL